MLAIVKRLREAYARDCKETETKVDTRDRKELCRRLRPVRDEISLFQIFYQPLIPMGSPDQKMKSLPGQTWCPTIIYNTERRPRDLPVGRLMRLVELHFVWNACKSPLLNICH